LASNEVSVFYETEADSRLDLTNVKCNLKRLSIDEKENVIAQIRPNNLRACENI
jgi:hypothetical protein